LASSSDVEVIAFAPETLVNVPVDVRQDGPAAQQGSKRAAANMLARIGTVQTSVGRCVRNKDTLAVKEWFESIEVSFNLSFWLHEDFTEEWWSVLVAYKIKRTERKPPTVKGPNPVVFVI
jgi:hypothetical protein